MSLHSRSGHERTPQWKGRRWWAAGWPTAPSPSYRSVALGKDISIALPFLIVVGLSREARIAAPFGRVAIGAAGLARAMAEATPIGIASFGLCGALDPDLKVGEGIIADGVISGEERWSTDAAWSTRLRAALPGWRSGDVAAGDVIVGSPADKAALRRTSGAATVDMESHAVAAAAAAAGLPFVVVRAVSDVADRALPKAALAGFKADGDPDIAAVIAALVRRPRELPAMIRVGLDSEAAFKALAVAVAALTPRV